MLEYAALVGIDWADAKHDVCLLDCATGRREPSVIRHTPEEFEQWADSLRRRYPGRKVAVCLEQSRGPLVYALLKYDFLTLYPINPKTLAKFCEALTPAGPRTTPATPPISLTCSPCTATGSGRGCLTTRKPGRCNTWSSTGVGSWVTAPGSATG